MFGWGISDFLVAFSSRKIGYFSTYFWTQIASLSIAIAYFFINPFKFEIFKISQSIILILLSSFLYFVATLAFYKGLVKGQISLVTPVGSSWPLITIILSVIFLREFLQLNHTIGFALIIFGIIFVSLNIKEVLKIKKFATLPGSVEGVIAMVGWGISLFLIVPVSRTVGWFLPVLILRAFGILFATGFIMLTQYSPRINFKISFFTLFFLIAFLDMIAFFGYGFGVKEASASIIAPIAASSPAVTVVLARIFFRESLFLNQIFGIISIITGLILISL